MTAFALRGVVLVAIICHGTVAATDHADDSVVRDQTSEAPFLAQNQQAMDTMMAGMTIKPSGDVDTDFAAMMIPHHQGAIDMAKAELLYGHNEALRRIAQEIIVEQQQEIMAMRLALGQTLPPSVASPDQPSDLATHAPKPTSTP